MTYPVFLDWARTSNSESSFSLEPECAVTELRLANWLPRPVKKKKKKNHAPKVSAKKKVST